MINEEATFRWKGYYSTDLSKGSHKKVWRNCDVCGDGRWVQFRVCTDLCHLCANRTEEHCRNLSISNSGKTCSDKTKKSMSDRNKGENNPFYGKTHTYKAKKSIGESSKCRLRTEESRIKQSASVQGVSIEDWDGYLSSMSYCDKFNEMFKEKIREKFGRLCFMCLATENDNGRKLCVHHVNYDKDCMCNGKDCEFVPVCMKCHNKTNGNRELWERLIINAMNYEGWI